MIVHTVMIVLHRTTLINYKKILISHIICPGKNLKSKFQ